MGYTHYWYREVNKDFDKSKWDNYVKDCKELHDHLPKNVKVQFEYDTKKPADFNKQQVRFNGIEDDGHETFLIHRECPEQPDYCSDSGDYFAFCKTATKPYDLLVTACLILLQYYFKVKVSSDGGREDWEPAERFIFNSIPKYKDNSFKGLSLWKELC